MPNSRAKKLYKCSQGKTEKKGVEMKHLTNAERSAEIAEQTEAYLKSGGSVHKYRQGDSGIERNFPFLFSKVNKGKKIDNWRVGDKGKRGY